MDKNLFIEVLKHYSECSEEEAIQIISLKESFPYSQLLHTLSARVSKDHGFTDHQAKLQLAAVYAADRAILKDVMTLDTIVVAKSKQSPRIVKAGAESLETDVVAEAIPTVDTGSVAEEVMIDLEKLHELKHNFEMMFVDAGSAEIKPQNDHADVESHSIPGEEVPTRESSKSKRERIIELAKALEASKQDIAPEDVDPKLKDKKTNPGPSIIEEIVSTKQEIRPENEKQKEQLEIIEQFIKTQPTITNQKDKPPAGSKEDLATIKTGEFSDNVVSETLVEILLKQGKKDKAIEVLKKLIWKFPQKKAYFAAQIEELKQ